ncbi:MAG: hypothetical protein EAX91_00730 [Candidatus Lokiarchaeota archaeon]|nr:hypothetical protein [Candidatus Lokiarchaeota archaeon]
MSKREREIYFGELLICLFIPFMIIFVSVFFFFSELIFIVLPGFLLAIILDKPPSTSKDEFIEKSKQTLKRKYDFQDLSWLKNQYFNLGKTLQDIAEDQNASMMQIKIYLDKIKEKRDFI